MSNEGTQGLGYYLCYKVDFYDVGLCLMISLFLLKKGRG